MPGRTTHDEVTVRGAPRKPMTRWQLALAVIAAGVFFSAVGWGLIFGVGAGIVAAASALLVLGVLLALLS